MYPEIAAFIAGITLGAGLATYLQEKPPDNTEWTCSREATVLRKTGFSKECVEYQLITREP